MRTVTAPDGQRDLAMEWEPCGCYREAATGAWVDCPEHGGHP